MITIIDGVHALALMARSRQGGVRWRYICQHFGVARGRILNDAECEDVKSACQRMCRELLCTEHQGAHLSFKITDAGMVHLLEHAPIQMLPPLNKEREVMRNETPCTRERLEDKLGTLVGRAFVARCIREGWLKVEDGTVTYNYARNRRIPR